MTETLRMTRAAGVVAAVAAAAALVGSCGGDGDGGTEPTTGRIEATVTLDAGAAAGVPVGLYAPGGSSALETAQTGATGVAVFSGLDAGSYDVEVTLPSDAELAAGETARKSVSVAAGGRATVSFGLASVGGGGEMEEVVLTSGLTFSPSSLTISEGTTVVWRNAAAVFHTVTPDGHSEWQSASLNQANETFSHTFDTPGTYAYYCQPHRGQGMTGTITVQ